MSLRRRSFLVACLSIVAGARGQAVQAGPFMSGIVDSVIATAERKFTGGAKQVGCLLIGGVLIVVPILLLKELADWLQADGRLSDQVRLQLNNLSRQLVAELKLPAGTGNDDTLRELTRLEKAYGPKVLQVLDPGMRVRFAEVRRQLQGAIGMTDDEAIAKLQLNAEQVASLKKIAAEQVAAARNGASQRRPLLAVAQLAAKKKEFDSRTREVLNPAQKVIWKKWIGTPIRTPLASQ